MNDKVLLESVRNGNDEDFRLLFDKYWEGLFVLAYKRLRSKEDANDIVQEVFISLWNNINNIQIEDSLGGYLYISLRNKIFNHFEKKTVRLKHILSLPSNPVESMDLILDNIGCKELQVAIAAEVALMPEKMKQIFLLSREQQMTISEIAILLLLSPQTVKNQLHKALQRLRESLRNNNLTAYLIFI